MREVAIDLTWVRHGIVGGSESYVLNLLNGFHSVNDKDIRYCLLVAKDNSVLYESFNDFDNFRLIRCNCLSRNRIWRVLWQNFGMPRKLKSEGIKICIEPVYLKPFVNSNKVRFITTIHDLQALHYPEFFDPWRVLWMKMCWKNAVRSSDYIIATSEHAKKDIIDSFGVAEEKLVLNYDPVVLESDNCSEERELIKYGVKPQEYYYIVSSLLPHKNIETIVKAMGILSKMNSKNFYPLVISGVGGKSRGIIEQLAEDNGIKDSVIITPFIDDKERNLLYKYCLTYLAPSLYEGFGLPPIEAMIMGSSLLSTYETCSYEISGGIAEYVKCAKDPKEWAEKLNEGVRRPDYSKVMELKERYSKENVARIFNGLVNEYFNE